MSIIAEIIVKKSKKVKHNRIMKKILWTLFVAALSFASCENKTATPAAEGEAAATEAIAGGDLAYVRVEFVLAESDIYKTEGVALQ